MSTKFNMTRDINGYNGFGVPFALDGMSTSLAANAEQHFTVPDNFANWIAVFSYTPGSNIFVDTITTAAVPGSTFAATTSNLNPSARAVKAGDVLSFITSDVTDPWVQVSLFVILPYTARTALPGY